MKISYTEHYDQSYWSGQKQYHDSLGQLRDYRGPSLSWSGFDEIARIIKQLCPGSPALDIGCGGGDLVSRLDPTNGWGLDISQFAIDHCNPSLKGRVAVRDITTEVLPTYFPQVFPLVLATDFMEHIYEEDIGDTFDYMWSLCSKWMFLCIATAPEDQKFVLKKGEEIPESHESVAIAGHVNVRSWSYWIEFFNKKGCVVEYSRMWRYCAEREKLPWLAKMAQWGPEFVYILRKK